MCGIVGYIGSKKATPILINGLLRLEYRGYDSAGIAVIENEEIKLLKDKGRVKNLYNLDGINDLKGTVGIAHTRWATHGIPSKENAHPHFDNSNSFAVVHNGIIENYSEIKEFLKNNGYTFYSQTDTEVIPNLVHYYYKKDDTKEKESMKVLKALRNTCKDLKGSYAIELLSNKCPDSLLIARKDSPLVIGKGEEENYISSDIPAILSFTNYFYLVENNEFAILTKNDVTFFDDNLNKIDKKVENIEWSATAAEKDGYEDYMLKEIYEQPNAIRETIGAKIPEQGPCYFDDFKINKEYLESINKIFIVACGTAMHAGMVGKNIIEKICKIPTETDIASEFRYRDPIIDEKTLCIFISQSGETADTIAALKLAKSKGSKTLAISNVIGSSITREADYSIYTHAGPEIAVASTKAYTSQVVLLAILAIYFAEILETESKTFLQELKTDILGLPSKIEEALKTVELIKKFSRKIFQEKDIFFLGRGIDYTVAQEASLKLKELSYIHSDAYAAGELKHGPIALIEQGITVIGILTDPKLVEKSISNIQEVITRGAKTLIITNQELPKNNFDEIIKVPEVNYLLSPVVSIIPLQFLAYYISKEKGLDVDKPRNLAKSVTVE